jgi:hypothetical protein
VLFIEATNQFNTASAALDMRALADSVPLALGLMAGSSLSLSGTRPFTNALRASHARPLR